MESLSPHVIIANWQQILEQLLKLLCSDGLDKL